MRILREFVVFVLVSLLAVPAWSDSSEVVGSVASGQSATLRNEPVKSGSTVFSGDAVSVGEDGRAQIAVTGGGQVAVLRGSAVQLTRKDATVELSVERGTVSFTGESNGTLDAVLGDATVRPIQGPVFGIIHMENPDSAVVIAEKGTLEIATTHSTGTTVVREGQAARITLVSDVSAEPPAKAKPGQTAAAGKAALSGKKLALIALIIGGAATVAGVVLSVEEPSQSGQTLGNETSPFVPK